MLRNILQQEIIGECQSEYCQCVQQFWKYFPQHWSHRDIACHPDVKVHSAAIIIGGCQSVSCQCATMIILKLFSTLVTQIYRLLPPRSRGTNVAVQEVMADCPSLTTLFLPLPMLCGFGGGGQWWWWWLYVLTMTGQIVRKDWLSYCNSFSHYVYIDCLVFRKRQKSGKYQLAYSNN